MDQTMQTRITGRAFNLFILHELPPAADRARTPSKKKDLYPIFRVEIFLALI